MTALDESAACVHAGHAVIEFVLFEFAFIESFIQEP